jgi:FemAB-related protein (PEP-CTERM system-associated)
MSTAPLTVISAGNDSGTQWDAFVASRPEGSFYHLFSWKRLNQVEFGHRSEYLVARRGEAIEGVLPLVFVTSPAFGRILCSVPFMNYGGPIAATPEAASALMARAATLSGELRADYLELRCTQPLTTEMPVSLRKVSMTIDLDPDPEKLWGSFTPKHRKNVRRAQKNDLEVRIGGIELLDPFYRVLELSWRQHGTPLYAKHYFRRVLEAFPGNTQVFVCQHKGKPVGVALVGHFNGTVEGMWAGCDPAQRELQANYVLYWEMIRHTCAAGYRKFHLGRSTADSGAEQFKAKWNAQTHQLYWYFHRPPSRGKDSGKAAEVPGLNVDNPKYRLAIAAWQHMPLWATRVLGPPLARGIP